MEILKSILDFFTKNGGAIVAGLIKVVFICVVGLLIIHILNKALSKILEKSKLEKAAHSLIKTLAKTVMCVLLVLILASSLGIDVTGIVALASVLTLAVSLALQNMLSNVIGGFTLIYTKPFSSGDYVEIAGQSGVVSEIGMAYTKLQTVDNKLVSIPNSAVVAAEIVNYTTLGQRRIDILVTASYGADSKTVIETLLNCAKHDKILSEPGAPFAAVNGYGESSIEYVLRFWTTTADYWDVYFEVLGKIKPEFDAKGVEMTYPHLNVHLDK